MTSTATRRRIEGDRPDYETVGDARDALTRGYPTEPSVEEVLEATSPEGLLRAFAHLTHRLHAAEGGGRRNAITRVTLRDERDKVEAELLSRMGGAR